jgi:hypothetical protein
MCVFSTTFVDDLQIPEDIHIKSGTESDTHIDIECKTAATTTQNFDIPHY